MTPVVCTYRHRQRHKTIVIYQMLFYRKYCSHKHFFNTSLLCLPFYISMLCYILDHSVFNYKSILILFFSKVCSEAGQYYALLNKEIMDFVLTSTLILHFISSTHFVRLLFTQYFLQRLDFLKAWCFESGKSENI